MLPANEVKIVLPFLVNKFFKERENDVAKERWSYEYISAAYKCGIINGVSDTDFAPGEKITRQDMAKIIYGAAKYKDIKLESAENVPVFADDAEIADYAKEAVYILKEMEKGKYRRVLIVPTGAIFSPTRVFQRDSIPSIAHAIALEVSI